jgi:RNA-dependent RNA polymerase
MNFDIMYIPSTANEWTVTRKIAEVLHSEDFTAIPMAADERPTNFKVKLNDSNLGGVRNNSTGTLTLPTTKIGHEFQRYIRKNPIRIQGKNLKFTTSNQPPAKGLALTLEKTPYINPDIEEQRQQIIHQLQDPLRVDEVQFGVYYRTYRKTRTTTKFVPPREYSVECKLDYTRHGEGWLRFEYDSKLIRIEVSIRLYFD